MDKDRFNAIMQNAHYVPVDKLIEHRSWRVPYRKDVILNFSPISEDIFEYTMRYRHFPTGSICEMICEGVVTRTWWRDP